MRALMVTHDTHAIAAVWWPIPPQAQNDHLAAQIARIVKTQRSAVHMGGGA
jgi:hypothetical protein